MTALVAVPVVSIAAFVAAHAMGEPAPESNAVTPTPGLSTGTINTPEITVPLGRGPVLVETTFSNLVGPDFLDSETLTTGITMLAVGGIPVPPITVAPGPRSLRAAVSNVAGTGAGTQDQVVQIATTSNHAQIRSGHG